MFSFSFWRLSSWISTYRCFSLNSFPHWGNSWIVTLGLVFVSLLWWIACFLCPMSFLLLIYSFVFLTLTFQLFPKRGGWAHEIFLVSLLACLQYLCKMSKQLINNLAGNMILGSKSFWSIVFCHPLLLLESPVQFSFWSYVCDFSLYESVFECSGC